MQCAEPPLPADAGNDTSTSSSSQDTQDALEEVDYRNAMSKQTMCVKERDVIFSKNIVTSTPLHCSYIRFDAEGRRKFIECRYVDCVASECGEAAHTEPTPVIEGEEEFPAQCSDKSHHGELVC